MRCVAPGCTAAATWRAILVVHPPLIGPAHPPVRAWCSSTFCPHHKAGATPDGLLPPVPVTHVMEHGSDTGAYLPRVGLEWQPLA